MIQVASFILDSPAVTTNKLNKNYVGIIEKIKPYITFVIVVTVE